MKTDLFIATISWARNEHEEKVLRTSLKQLAEVDVPVCITDGGSTASFIEFLHSTPHFIVRQAKGLWPQARLSIATAMESGAQYIFYTEPDKLQFFSKHLKQMLDAIEIENAGLVLASRSAKGFSSFPSFQQMTETTINNCCKEIIGKEMDYCYGPFLFNSNLVPYLKVLDDTIGWGWRPFLFAIAHRLGFSVTNFEGDFTCPPDQQEDDESERIYRMKQLTQNINGVTQAATMNLQQQ
ncbi:MAG: hypothetical protein J7502_05695 [Flavisolibacter sp.]|nr:hypothetical protein [Flavisolibacter sp.]